MPLNVGKAATVLKGGRVYAGNGLRRCRHRRMPELVRRDDVEAVGMSSLAVVRGRRLGSRFAKEASGRRCRRHRHRKKQFGPLARLSTTQREIGPTECGKAVIVAVGWPLRLRT